MKTFRVVFLVMTMVLGVASLVYAFGGTTILISEVEYDNEDDFDSEPGTEWFELYNMTESPFTISGWTIEDNSSSDTIPDITIPAIGRDGQPGGTIVVAGDKTQFLTYYQARYGQLFPRPDLVVDVGGTIGNGLSNAITGDRLILKDDQGANIDALSWGEDTTAFTPACPDVVEGHSLARTIRPPHPVDNDNAGDWHDRAVPNPDFSLPVTLSTFTAISIDSGIILKWRTESEIGNVGFNIYRSEKKDGGFIKINDEMIPGAGNSAMPNDYQFTDKTTIKGREYYYYLEDVDVVGTRNKFSIISISQDAKKLTTTWGRIKGDY
jgi:hypothetical protein